MPAPRVTIPELPEQTTVLGSELIAVQDGSTTKKMVLSKITQQDLAPRVSNLETADSAFNTRVSQVETVNGGQDTAIAGLLTETSTLDTRVDNHDTTLATHTGQISTQGSTIATHTGQISTNANGLSTLSGRVTTAEGTIVTNTNRIGALELQGIPPVVLNAQIGTTYTLVLGDASKLITLSNAAAIALKVPNNSVVAFPIGTRIELAWIGVGQPTVSAVSSAVISSALGLKLRVRYAVGRLTKIATDTWLLDGDTQV